MIKTPPTLLEELATIDAALLEDAATDQQEKRGQELVALANAAFALLSALERAETQLSEYCMSDDGRDKDARQTLNAAREAIALATGRAP